MADIEKILEQQQKKKRKKSRHNVVIYDDLWEFLEAYGATFKPKQRVSDILNDLGDALKISTELKKGKKQ